MKKKFINFLTSKKVLSTFISNFNLHESQEWRRMLGYPIRMDQYFKKIDPQNYIDCAFSWGGSRNNRPYILSYSELSDLWQSVYISKVIGPLDNNIKIL